MPVTFKTCSYCKGEIILKNDTWEHISFLDTLTEPHDPVLEEEQPMTNVPARVAIDLTGDGDDEQPTTVFPPVEVDDGLTIDQQDRVQALQAAGAVLRLHQETFTIHELLLVADWVLTGRQPS